MTERRVETVTGLLLRIRLAQFPTLGTLGQAIDYVNMACSLVRIPVEHNTPDGPMRSWGREQWRVVDVRLGSLELVITSTAVLVGGALAGASKTLPALMTFMEGIRDWRANKRRTEAATRSAELDVADREEALNSKKSQQDLTDEVSELIRSVNQQLHENGIGEVHFADLQLPSRRLPRSMADRRRKPNAAGAVWFLVNHLEEVREVDIP